MTIINQITSKLLCSLNPTHLEVTDESSDHFGHAGYREGEVTHIKIIVRSDVFQGMTKLAMHRLIYKIINEELALQIHAIKIGASI